MRYITAVVVGYHQVLAGEDHPEAEERRVEEALTDVGEDEEEWHVQPQRQDFDRH